MRKMVSGFVARALILGAILYQEWHPNRYVENSLFLGRLWIFVGAVVAWTLVLGFAMGIPSPRVGNMAATYSSHPSRIKAILGSMMHVQDWCIFLVSLAVGRWWFFLCFGVYMIGGMTARKSAREYMKRVKLNEKTKHAIIDVN
jgi:hypothetical protein